MRLRQTAYTRNENLSTESHSNAVRLPRNFDESRSLCTTGNWSGTRHTCARPLPPTAFLSTFLHSSFDAKLRRTADRAVLKKLKRPFKCASTQECSRNGFAETAQRGKHRSLPPPCLAAHRKSAREKRTKSVREHQPSCRTHEA